MADFRTTLEQLAQGKIEFDAVARNIEKLLAKRPQAAVTIMDQLKQAVVDAVIDAETYARLKTRITVKIESVPMGDADAPTRVAGLHDDATRMAPSAGEERTVFAPPMPQVLDTPSPVAAAPGWVAWLFVALAAWRVGSVRRCSVISM